MTIKSTLGSALLMASLFAAAPVFAAADPSIHQVYEAAASGRFDDAQAMMDKVLHDHPNSATAHYVEADILAKQGRMSQAQSELSTAERIDPSLKFAKPQALQELRSVIAGGQHVATRPVYMQPAQPVYQQPIQRQTSSGGSGTTIIIVIAMVILFFVIVRMLSRRNTVVQTYGPGGMQQGYGPGYGPGMVVGGQGGGIGSGILGGLATGAAVGAGIVAGEELMHHFTDRDRTETVYDTPQNNNWSQPDDMGGNDFGVSDSSSWDSGGGGGSDDWN